MNITCPSCGRENEEFSEFCVQCGLNLKKSGTINTSNRGEIFEEDDATKWEKSYIEWKRSIPYMIAVLILLTFIDLVTGGSAFDWSYWATIPILLFAIIAPYFSFKIK